MEFFSNTITKMVALTHSLQLGSDNTAITFNGR